MILDQLWQIAEDLRSSAGELNLEDLMRVAQSSGLEVTIDHVRELEPLLSSAGRRWWVPSTLVHVCIYLALARKAKTILDPWATYGLLILPIANAAHCDITVAISPDMQESVIGSQLSRNMNVTWICDDPLAALMADSNKYEMVVSCRPFNIEGEPSSIVVDGVSINDDCMNQLVAMALSRLSETGQGLVVLSKETALSLKPSALVPSLPALGLFLNALLHFPSGFFWPMGIETYVAVISRIPFPDLFIGEIRDLQSHNDLLLTNLISRIKGDDLSLGELVNQGDFRGYRQYETSHAAARLAKRAGLSGIPLKDVVVEINLTKERDPAAFPDRDNAVYLPTTGKSNAASARSDLTLKAHNYAQIVLNSEKALSPYVASYFNSPLGYLARKESLTGALIPRITKESLLDVTVYLPDFEIQRNCIECDSRALNLMSEISSIRDGMWSQPRAVRNARSKLEQVNGSDNVKTWIDTLPFPIASILWTYLASGDDDKKSVDHLLHFYEALAEFIALVLWSAIKTSTNLVSHDKYPVGKKRPLNYPLDHSSFGSWVELAGRLAKFIRACLADTEESKDVFEAFRTSNTAIIEMLCSKRVIGQIADANAIRNKLAHGGIGGAQDAKNHRIILENMLAVFRQEIGSIWDECQLMKTGAMRFRKGVFYYDAELVMGRSTPFERKRVEVTTPIEDGGLFLLASDSREPLILEPLMIIASSPQNVENACYFYNSTKGEELRFISYHFRGQPEIMRTDERVMQALESLGAGQLRK